LTADAGTDKPYLVGLTRDSEKAVMKWIIRLLILAICVPTVFALDRFVKPYLAFSTYWGGESEGSTLPAFGSPESKPIAVSKNGNVWVCFKAFMGDLPLVNPLWPDCEHNEGALCEFSSEGALLMSTYFYGSYIN
jgi:hypothetical protein